MPLLFPSEISTECKPNSLYYPLLGFAPHDKEESKPSDVRHARAAQVPEKAASSSPAFASHTRHMP